MYRAGTDQVYDGHEGHHPVYRSVAAAAPPCLALDTLSPSAQAPGQSAGLGGAGGAHIGPLGPPRRVGQKAAIAHTVSPAGRARADSGASELGASDLSLCSDVGAAATAEPPEAECCPEMPLPLPPMCHSVDLTALERALAGWRARRVRAAFGMKCTGLAHRDSVLIQERRPRLGVLHAIQFGMFTMTISELRFDALEGARAPGTCMLCHLPKARCVFATPQADAGAWEGNGATAPGCACVCERCVFDTPPSPPLSAIAVPAPALPLVPSPALRGSACLSLASTLVPPPMQRAVTH